MAYITLVLILWCSIFYNNPNDFKLVVLLNSWFKMIVVLLGILSFVVKFKSGNSTWHYFVRDTSEEFPNFGNDQILKNICSKNNMNTALM